MSSSRIEANLKKIHLELEKVNLIAVTKYSPVEDVVEAYNCGQLDFGENRVQDLLSKSLYFKENNLNRVRWHFIGHLQTNKVRDLMKITGLYSIHSIDSLKLLNELIKRENLFDGDELKLFFQVNTSNEDEKSGFIDERELYHAIEKLIALKSSKLRLFGLMTMSSARAEDYAAEARTCFSKLVSLANKIQADFSFKDRLMLSMGMSSDYKIAKEFGSDYVRIGSAIFK